MCHTHLRARRCDLWGRQWDQLLLSGDQIFTPGRQTAQMRNWCNGCIIWDEGMPRGAKQILGFEEAWQSLILRNPTWGTVALINWDKFGDIQGFGSKNTQHPTLL